MARISLDPPRSISLRLAEMFSRRRFDAVLEPALAMAHNPRALRTNARAELGYEKLTTVPADLKHLAVMASAARVHCSWCMDFGYWVAHTAGVGEAKVRDIPRWRDSDAYTPVERAALRYADAMSATPMEVTDDMVDELLEHLDEGQLVELTMMIAVENQRARFNSALGLTSQGFADRCELAEPSDPSELAEPSERSEPAAPAAP